MTTFNRRTVHAQDKTSPFPRAPHCTNGTASGTYGYRMAGQIVGVGLLLVNGLFTHNPDGTMVFTAMDRGETLYFQGTDPGVAVSGVARGIR
jgi:hypothetical protein